MALVRATVLVLLACAHGLKVGGGNEKEERGTVHPSPAAGVQERVRRAVDRAGTQATEGVEATRAPEAAAAPSAESAKPLLVVGSLNVDLTVEVDRLPTRGETVASSKQSLAMALGGKGANQAVAAARLSHGTGRRTQFVCQFGDDAHAAWLEQKLGESGCDLTGSGVVPGPSGTGLVLLQPDGAIGSVVVGGANAAWSRELAEALAPRVSVAGALMLQREVPEVVNEVLAAAAHASKVPVILDIGGEERPISDRMLSIADYVCPNESELARLSGLPVGTLEQAKAAAAALQRRGARGVLVTLGARGAFLLGADGSVLEQGPCPVPGGRVVDETGAGDAFRAAFAVALVEERALPDCMLLASAAGALAVAAAGAEPSLPTRAAAVALAASGECAANVVPAPPAAAQQAVPVVTGAAAQAGGAQAAPPALHGDFSAAAAASPSLCPLQFASRLNSMKDRAELWSGSTDTLGLVARQGTVEGLGLVDFNYPQHLKGVRAKDASSALKKAGLKAGAICMRYEKEHQAGAFTHPDAAMRAKAIELTMEGARYALSLGAGELVVWSAYDGYDYHHQVDYVTIFERVVDAFQQICDAFPTLRISLEFKPTDENTRFFAVPSTGAALHLAAAVGRPNFGLTLDIGHMIMAGENPAQSVAMVGKAGKLFGVQLNDGHAKLGAEDGLMFGSVHGNMALDFIRWLQKTGYDGHLYFDTFPRNEDPVREAAYNIRRVKALWAEAARLTASGIEDNIRAHDAMGSLELMESLAASRCTDDDAAPQKKAP